MSGRREKHEGPKNKMVIFNENVDQFVDMGGSVTGPYTCGQLVNLDVQVAELFVSSGKASFVDD